MARIEIYRNILRVANEKELCERFIATLLSTNRTHAFFVDWEKVRANVENLKFEISILGAICGSSCVEADFRKALSRHPEVARVIPLILAVRGLRLSVLEDTGKPALSVKEYDFRCAGPVSEEWIDGILDFCSRTGIIALFADLRIGSLRDYLLGVEVGMDTNARKNRSGSWMERQVETELGAIAQDLRCRFIRQRTYGSLANEGIDIPRQLRNRKFDTVCLVKKAKIGMEFNFFGGGGSKPQEIIDSYIDRQRQLGAEGWRFILVTDGMGWSAGTNQLRRGIEELDFIMNLAFVRAGLLRAAIQECARAV